MDFYAVTVHELDIDGLDRRGGGGDADGWRGGGRRGDVVEGPRRGREVRFGDCNLALEDSPTLVAEDHVLELQREVRAFERDARTASLGGYARRRKKMKGAVVPGTNVGLLVEPSELPHRVSKNLEAAYKPHLDRVGGTAFQRQRLDGHSSAVDSIGKNRRVQV